MLEVRIVKQLPSFTLDVDFRADDEIMALLGSSGCGKSMTLKCIAGIVKPDRGRIVLNDRVLFDSEKNVNLPPQQRRVGYLFQQYALFPHFTVAQNIAAGYRGRDKAARSRAVQEKIQAMRLQGLENDRPNHLSGGQQQRVALARILINEPELLLLDEPFTALDSYLKWQLEMELADALKRFGHETLFVSHNRDEVYRLCDSVCVLDQGKSQDKQSTQALFHHPQTYAACLLSGCKNFSAIRRLDGGRTELANWGIVMEGGPPIPEDAASVGVRSRSIHISREKTGEQSFPCRIERRLDDISCTVLMLRPVNGRNGAVLRVEIDKDAEQARDWLPGQSVYAWIANDQMMFLQ
ncbi:MAG: ATP-binding cassette domain-containing protein [Firmicutes bacterium]|nr:ATP-binding cassette domain-containing protein [Bacillota bacterium]